MKAQTHTDSTNSPQIAPETPAARRRKRVRDAIIQAAERVFAKEGPEGLSIRRLADEIDYSPSAIYKYFTSKTELVAVLQEDFFEGLVARIEEVKSRPDTPLSICARDSVSTYVHTALARPHHYAAAFSGVGQEMSFDEEGPRIGSETDNFRVRAFTMLSELVQECKSVGIFRQDLDVSVAAKSLWASMHGLAMLIIHLPSYGTTFVDREGMAQEDFISLHADLVIRGLEAK